MTQRKGRVTIPTDLDVVPQTLEMLDKWGADAIRDCDGTEFPEKLKNTGAKIYATYYTTRKDNKWAKENPDEIQQMYIMTSFHTAVSDTLHLCFHYIRKFTIPTFHNFYIILDIFTFRDAICKIAIICQKFTRYIRHRR